MDAGEVEAPEQPVGTDDDPAADAPLRAAAAAECVLEGAEEDAHRDGGLHRAGLAERVQRLTHRLRRLAVLGGARVVGGEELVAEPRRPDDVGLPRRLPGWPARRIDRGDVLDDAPGILDVALQRGAVRLDGGVLGVLLEPLERPLAPLREGGEPLPPLRRAADHSRVPGELVPARLAAEHATAVGESGEPAEHRGAGEVLVAEPDQPEQTPGGHRVLEPAAVEGDVGNPGLVEGVAEQRAVGLLVAIDDRGAMERHRWLGLGGGEQLADRAAHLGGAEQGGAEVEAAATVLEMGEGDHDRGACGESPEQLRLGRVDPGGEEHDHVAGLGERDRALAGAERPGGGGEQVDLVVQTRRLTAVLVAGHRLERRPSGQRAPGADPVEVAGPIGPAAQLGGQPGDEVDQAGVNGGRRERPRDGGDRGAHQRRPGDGGERRPSPRREPAGAERFGEPGEDGEADVGIAAGGEPAAEVEAGMVTGHHHRHRVERVVRLEVADADGQPRGRGRSGSDGDELGSSFPPPQPPLADRCRPPGRGEIQMRIATFAAAATAALLAGGAVTQTTHAGTAHHSHGSHGRNSSHNGAPGAGSSGGTGIGQGIGQGNGVSNGINSPQGFENLLLGGTSLQNINFLQNLVP